MNTGEKVTFDAIFSPFRLGPHKLKNRLVALPVFTGYAYADGHVSPPLIEHYRRLAGSGVSMVVVANAAVAANGVASIYNLRIDHDRYIPGLAELAGTIKACGALACVQLNHAGRFAKTNQPMLPAPAESKNIAFNVAALKDFMEFFPLEKRFGLTRNFLKQVNTWRREMTAENRQSIIDDFGNAAARACRAGFDLIELHGANGYLLCQFLSAFTNPTPSDFGGEFENRTVFPLAVIRNIKKRLPPGFPIGFRLIVREWVPHGIDLDQAVAFARLLKKEGIAYLSASAGSFNSIFLPEVLKKMARPAYLRDDVRKLTSAVGIPTIIAGRITIPSMADKLLRQKVADLIGLGRSLRADPEWARKARGADRRIRTCINCNWCLKRVVLEQGFNCRRWPRLEQQRADLNHQMLGRNFKMLCLVDQGQDLKRFKETVPYFLPTRRHFPAPFSFTVLFLQTENQARIPAGDQALFLEWSRKKLDLCGFAGAETVHAVQPTGEPWESDLRSAVIRGNYGVILMARNPQMAWQERFLYKQRRKVIGLIGSSERSKNILVPVDLSDTTLLILMFLRETVLGQENINLNTLHILKGSARSAEQRWKAFKKICDLKQDLPLQMIPAKGDIAADLLDIVERHGYGTVIMGKRGISGVKRWLLGSVSASVLKGLSDQSLFLVD